ncbi:GGDEF domain-containing protein [Luteimonas pelagia]
MNADASAPVFPARADSGLYDRDAVLNDDEFALFEQVGRSRRVEGGEVLFRRGDLGGTMYVIAEGEVDLDFGEDLTTKRLGVHEFFGELGLLIGDHARSADAIVVSPGRLLELNKPEFERIARESPEGLSKFLRRAILRVVRSEQSLLRRVRRRNLELQTAVDTLRTTTARLDLSEQMVRTDELTGLPNRRGLSLHMQKRRQHDNRRVRGVVLVDCDGLKAFNDVHGHNVGDRVLQGVAGILRGAIDDDEIACRMGSDEFALVLETGDREAILARAQRVQEAARAMVANARPNLPPPMVKLSIGACAMPPHHHWDDWYAVADAAVHRAKHKGGDCIEWADDARRD